MKFFDSIVIRGFFILPAGPSSSAFLFRQNKKTCLKKQASEKIYGQAMNLTHICRWLLYSEASSSLSSRFPDLPIIIFPRLLTDFSAMAFSGEDSWITVTGSPEILTPFPFKIHPEGILHSTNYFIESSLSNNLSHTFPKDNHKALKEHRLQQFHSSTAAADCQRLFSAITPTSL